MVTPVKEHEVFLTWAEAEAAVGGALAGLMTPREYIDYGLEYAPEIGNFTVPADLMKDLRTPLSQAAVTVTVGGAARTVVDVRGGLPAVGQVAIDFVSGRWYFNVADVGLACAYTLTPREKCVTSGDLHWLQALVRQLQGEVLLGIPRVQGSASGVNLKVAGATTLYTVPAGATGTITRVVLLATAVTVAPGVQPPRVRIDVGGVAVYGPEELFGMTAAGKEFVFGGQGVGRAFAETEEVELVVEDVGDWTALTVTVEVEGRRRT